jgi:hypothetical protein
MTTITTTHADLSPLAAAINDPTVTFIGDPWRGTYHLRLDVTELANGEQLRLLLVEGLRADVTVSHPHHGTKTYLCVYKVEQLARILEACGEQLEESQREKLDVLVRARSPIPPAFVDAFRERRNRGLTHEQIAAELNDKRVPDGMEGKGWTAKKVRRALQP